ncbi:hypothetical protein [Microbacterium sp. Root61]|uniref:aggregation-promoting factor C-terminal-like domain-containing protein n=1 Tax=Microbacterium sp. Root61 TaxID=1736570 RepID=UPI0009E9173A|nr:hypothetical protein [Microbacterium sp. Root61]
MRFRTLARLRNVHHAKRNLTTATIAIALVAATGISFGAAASAVAATAPAETPAATVVATVERPIDQDAAFNVVVASAVEKSAAGKVDATTLTQRISELDDSSSLPDRSVRVLTRLVRESAAEVATAVSAYNAQAAAEAAAAAAAAAQAAADALAQANTPDGARATARAMAASSYGWGDAQFSCLSSLWQKESSWNYQAYNPSGATGIPQALPGSKMASSGSDWATSATTQISWGLGYIASVYGTPCSAWGHSQSFNWY